MSQAKLRNLVDISQTPPQCSELSKPNELCERAHDAQRRRRKRGVVAMETDPVFSNKALMNLFSARYETNGLRS